MRQNVRHKPKIKLDIRIDEGVVNTLKLYAIMDGDSLSDLIRDAISDYMKKRKRNGR